MMKTLIGNLKTLIRGSLLLSASLLINACSDGGGLLVAEGGISGTGISSGSITGFSSVILNGRKLEITPETEIFVDEQISDVSALRVGQVVRVDADFDDDVANRIDYLETVRGPLSAMPVFNADTLAGSMEILGQPVITNSITVLDGLEDLSTLLAGNVLEVSGVRNSGGAIVARYIQLKTSSVDEYRVLGTATGVSSSTSTFSIGGLTVDYQSVDTSAFGSAGIEEGDEVLVRAESAGYTGGPLLVASKVTPSTLKIALSSGDDLEMEGIITEIPSLSNLVVNDVVVDTSGVTIENGLPRDLRLDVLIEIEGSVNDSSVLEASRIKIIPLSNIRVEATVDRVDIKGNAITVLSQQYLLDEKTQLKDASSAGVVEFSLDDLRQGNWVELRAYEIDGQLFLSRLERDDADKDVRIQGPVESVAKAVFSVKILGVDLFTGTDTKYENISNQEIEKSVFFDQVKESDLVRARWKDFTSIDQPVDELSFEED